METALSICYPAGVFTIQAVDLILNIYFNPTQNVSRE
jgi:hypothetical protein